MQFLLIRLPTVYESNTAADDTHVTVLILHEQQARILEQSGTTHHKSGWAITLNLLTQTIETKKKKNEKKTKIAFENHKSSGEAGILDRLRQFRNQSFVFLLSWKLSLLFPLSATRIAVLRLKKKSFIWIYRSLFFRVNRAVDPWYLEENI